VLICCKTVSTPSIKDELVVSSRLLREMYYINYLATQSCPIMADHLAGKHIKKSLQDCHCWLEWQPSTNLITTTAVPSSSNHTTVYISRLARNAASKLTSHFTLRHDLNVSTTSIAKCPTGFIQWLGYIGPIAALSTTAAL
jgi:hypothetical protein